MNNLIPLNNIVCLQENSYDSRINSEVIKYLKTENFYFNIL